MSGWNRKTPIGQDVDRARLRQLARERLKAGSFWVGKPRDGFTAECERDAKLMSAGPCGSFTPRLSIESNSWEPMRKKNLGIYL
jgi:hypothetical protein